MTAGSSTAWIVYLYATRFIAGTGIGGEYAAINSAIDELIPARYRGRVDIAVNGTYWAGAILGTLGELVLLNALDPSLGWRIGFLIGPVLGVVILFVRRNLPESPRWQIMHGQADEAEQSIRMIEQEVERTGRPLPAVDQSRAIDIKPVPKTGYVELTRVLFAKYPRRSVLGASLMISQSFLYNAIFFTYTLVLTRFYGVSGGVGAVVPHRVRSRQPDRAARTGAVLRHGRPQGDDLRHLHRRPGRCWRSPRSCSAPGCSVR